MDAQILQLRFLPNAPPRALKVGEVLAGKFSGNHIGIVFLSLDLGEQVENLFSNIDFFCSGLRVRQVNAVLLDVLPFQGLDFAHAAAGEDQEAIGVASRWAFAAIAFAFIQGFPEAFELFFCEEAFPLLFLVFFDVTARIGAVGAEAPDFTLIEDDRKDAKGAIGLIGLVAVVVVKLGNVRAGNVGDLVRPQSRFDEQVYGAAVFVGCAFLAVGGNVFIHEAFADRRHGRGTPVGGAGLGWVVALRNLSQNFFGFLAGLFRGEGAVRAKRHAAGPSAMAVLNLIGLFAALENAEAEAVEVFIPDEILRSRSFGGIHNPLRYLRHSAPRFHASKIQCGSIVEANGAGLQGK